MDMQLITNAASATLANIVLAVIALAGAYAVYYIRLAGANVKAQTKKIKDETARQLLENALDDVVNLATVSVNAMEQTTAKAIRDGIKAGANAREQLTILGTKVFCEVKAAISPEAQRIITENLGSFDDYLEKCIEDAVLKVKRDDPYLTISGELLDGVLEGQTGQQPEPDQEEQSAPGAEV